MPERETEAEAFPRLDDDQVAALGRCPLTDSRHYRDGDRLFRAGDCGFRFQVIRSGEVAIVDTSGDEPKTIAVLGPGEFTGDETKLTGGPSIVDGVARGDCEVYEVSLDALRRILNDHPDLGDVMLLAFIARRRWLSESGEVAGLRVVGPKRSQETFRVRDFLMRNRVPFTWIDPESDPGASRVLEGFGFDESEAPLVAWGRKVLLRNPSNRQLADALSLRGRMDRDVYDLAIVGAGRRGWRRRSTGPPRGWRRSSWSAPPPAARPGGACGSTTTWASPPGSPAPSWPSAPSSRPTASAPGSPSRPTWSGCRSTTAWPCSTWRGATGSGRVAC